MRSLTSLLCLVCGFLLLRLLKMKAISAAVLGALICTGKHKHNQSLGSGV